MVPQRLRGGIAALGRNGIVQHDVAMLTPDARSCSDSTGSLVSIAASECLISSGYSLPLTAALMRATRAGSTPPVVATIQCSNSQSSARCGQENLLSAR